MQQKSVMRKLRRDNDWSIAYVALKTKVNAATVSMVERGLQEPSADVAAAFEKFFGLSIKKLLSPAPESLPIRKAS